MIKTIDLFKSKRAKELEAISAMNERACTDALCELEINGVKFIRELKQTLDKK